MNYITYSRAFLLSGRLKRLTAVPILLILAGCAAVNSGHYPTDFQKRVMAIPSGHKLLLVPLMGDTLYLHFLGVDVFETPVSKLKTHNISLNHLVVNIVQRDIRKDGKFRIKLLSAQTSHRLNAKKAPDEAPNISKLLALAKLRHTPYLMVVWAGGTYSPFFGKSSGPFGYGANIQNSVFQQSSEIYCVERMAIYYVASGRELGTAVAIKTLQVPLNSIPANSEHVSEKTFENIEKVVLNLAKKATEDNLRQFGLIGYFVTHSSG